MPGGDVIALGGQLVRRDVNLSGATISQEIYGYDQMSRMLSLDRIEDGLTRRDAWGYSPAGELTSAKYDLVNNINPNRTVSYALDNVGNRTSVNENGVATAYVPDNINRYSSIGGSPVGTGGAHQVISYQGDSYAYIGDTYLAKMTSGDGHNLTLGYDALGRCVQRTPDGNSANTTYYLYDGEKPIQEVGATLASNLYGAGIDEIVERDVSGNTYFFFQDHEGSVTHVADLGGLTERYRYDAFGAPTVKGPFGAVRTGGSLIGNRFLFTGREYDEDFGIYEYRARAYNPELGRFMTEDPKGFAAGDYNLFRYCKNDPLDLTDPMGLEGNGAVAVEVRKGPWGMMTGSNLPQDTSEQFPGGLPYYHMAQVSIGHAGPDPRLSRFHIPEAISRDASVADKFTKQNPAYDGRAIVGALERVLADGRIVVGQSKDFIGSNNGERNVFTTYDQIIHVNLASHPRQSLLPALLAHEGEHLIDRLNDGHKELRGFEVQHGFARALGVFDQKIDVRYIRDNY